MLKIHKKEKQERQSSQILEKAIRNPRLKIPARASVFYFAASAAAKVIGLATTPIFTRILSGEGYGEYTLYMSRLGFLSLLITSVAAGTQGYTGLSENEDKKDEYIRSLFGVVLCFLGIICLLLFAFSGLFGLSGGLITVLSVQLLCDCALSVSYMRARYCYNYTRVCVTALIQSLLSPILAIVLIKGAGVGYLGRIYGLLIASAAVAVPALSDIIGRGGKFYDRDMWRSIIGRAAPLLPYALSSALSLQIDKLVIGAIMGSVALAKYSVAHSLGAALSMATGALFSALSPWIVRKLASHSECAVREIGGRCALLLGAAAVLPVAIAPEAMAILAPREYSEAISAVLPITLSTLPTFFCAFCSVGLINARRSGRVSLYSTASSLCSILLGLILIPRLAYFGAGLSLLLAQTVGAVLAMRFLSRSAVRDILPRGGFALAGVLSGGLCTAAYVLRGNLSVRVAIAVLAMGVMLSQAVGMYKEVREKGGAAT